MMVPKPTLEQGKEIDCYLDSRPLETARINDRPAIEEVGKTNAK